MDRRLQRSEPLDFVLSAGTRHLRHRWLGDDYMGYDAVAFSWSELMDVASTGPRDLVFTIQGGGGIWEVNATLTVTKPRDNPECSLMRRS